MTHMLVFTCLGSYNNPNKGKAAVALSSFSEKEPEVQRGTVTYLSLLSKW